ncbi:MAG: hypothetical protein U0136_21665 [Bdellovibrionota bacterium]
MCSQSALKDSTLSRAIRTVIRMMSGLRRWIQYKRAKRVVRKEAKSKEQYIYPLW